MKKILPIQKIISISGILAVLAFVSGCLAIALIPHASDLPITVKQDGFTARVHLDYAEVISCSNVGDVVFPKRIRGRKVTELRVQTGAFFDSANDVYSVTIPDGVTKIGSRVFSDCSSLKSITLPFVGATKDGMDNTHFGYIFGASSYSDNYECVPESLKTVVITGVTSIDSSAFSGCISLESITIPDGVTSIGSSAFSGCISLERIIIPDGVTSIGDYVFFNCAALKKVVLSEGVTSIGNSAFSDCSALTSVIIPASVTKIGNHAFLGCNSLTDITIPRSVTSIGYYTFYDCPNLTIYAEATSKPAGWAYAWNIANCPVVWNYRGA